MYNNIKNDNTKVLKKRFVQLHNIMALAMFIPNHP